MSRRRVYLFGIGSPAWQTATGHIVSPLGVPIPVRRSVRKLVALGASSPRRRKGKSSRRRGR